MTGHSSSLVGSAHLKRGYLYGALGMLGFSLTLPATRIADAGLAPLVVGLGRALIAAVLSLVALIATKQRFPDKRHILPITAVAAGVVVGFPVFTSLAMKHVDASHGAVVLGLLPITTAAFGSMISGERPSALFWFTAALGTAIVVGFLLFQAHGSFRMYDLMLFGGVLSAAIGYAVGAKLATVLGSWRVISWALLFAAPFLLIPVTLQLRSSGFHPSAASLLGFLYVSCVSMFFAFFAWYKGLALGGTAKVGLLQLLQPFFTIAASSLLLNERVSWQTILVAFLVGIVVFVSRMTKA